MGLRMKNFSIMRVHWKIRNLGGVHEKPIYRGNCLKKGLGQFAGLREGLAKKEGAGVFEGVETRMYTMAYDRTYDINKMWTVYVQYLFQTVLYCLIVKSRLKLHITLIRTFL